MTEQNKVKTCDVVGCNNKAIKKVKVVNLTGKKSFKWVCSKHYEELKNHGLLLFI